MIILNAFIIPIVCSVCASFLTLYMLKQIKPDFQISSEIAKFKSSRQSCSHGYIIKVINKSKRSAIDIRGRLALAETKIVSGGSIMRTSDFTLDKDFQFEIPGYNENEPEASAFRFFTYDNLEEKWRDEQNHLIFILYAKDSLSGFGKVFTQRYYLKRGVLKEGSFSHGASMEII